MTAPDNRKPLTWRSVAVGLIGSAVVTVWIHHAELILGGDRGHTALANTSIPVGAFGALTALLVANLAIRTILPRLALSQGELITAYVMMTVSTVLASSGGIHFLVPTLAAAFHYATPENQWQQFHRWIPTWFAPRGKAALDAFYIGGASMPVKVWLTPFLVWGGFLFTFTCATLCVSAILRRPWIDHERLTFPTVVLPLELTEPGGRLLKNGLMWMGFGLAFGIGTINNLHLNFPVVPGVQVRGIDVSSWFPRFPWNAMGSAPVSFYPFIIGIAYLLSLEVSFSYWFFFLLAKAQLVFCAALGWRMPGAAMATDPPYLSNQGAGAFIGLALISLWMSRSYLRQVALRAFGRHGALPGEEREPLPYRWAVFGLLACGGALVAMCWAAGMNPLIAALVFGLVLLYLIAATRIRAEAGNAWLYGPEVDPNTLVTESLGAVLRPVDLTVMAYLRSVTTFDMRCVSMPHQLDGFRMGMAAGIPLRQLAMAMLVAIPLAIAVAFWSGLGVWYALGAAAKTDVWRTEMGMQPFIQLHSQLTAPQRLHFGAIAFDGVGLAVTC